MVKSYCSAVRTILKQEGIFVTEKSYILSALTRACKLKYNRVQTRLPIQKGLLHLIIDQVNNSFLNKNQPYLTQLFVTMIITSYYGLLRAGQITRSPHNIKAMDVHVGCPKPCPLKRN